MDILIKNIEMPKKGQRKFLIIDDNRQVSEFDGYYSFITITRAIELPPHGRLIDADIMKEAFEATALIEASRDKGNEQIYFDRIKLVHGIIDRTPTFLEAST